MFNMISGFILHTLGLPLATIRKLTLQGDFCVHTFVTETREKKFTNRFNH